MKILVNGKLIVEDDWINFRVVVVGQLEVSLIHQVVVEQSKNQGSFVG